ncbi:MAG TPA: hypothetical protein VL326_36930 [Kofleriaceae bacterium]|nr:hypothetical protein [Kofleriaceae bacterium]
MRTLSVFVALLAAACGPGSMRGDDDDGMGSGSGSGSNTDGCSDAAKLVYVVDANNTLSKFDPMTKTFMDIGTLSCPGEGGGLFGGAPFSMGIDRNAVAWVLFSDGKLFQVDTTSAACTATTWTTQQGELLFGMGFSANTAGSTDDTLFIAGGSSDPMSSPTSKLATLSTSSFSASPVGNVTGWPELTGNGKAELWGWFPDASAPRIEQINKTTGAPIKTYNLPMLAGTPMAWAFAFWGGDYWIFLEKSTETKTTVYQVKGDTGVISTMTPANGREIVGAGVSTCAPVVIL